MPGSPSHRNHRSLVYATATASTSTVAGDTSEGGRAASTLDGARGKRADGQPRAQRARTHEGAYGGVARHARDAGVICWMVCAA
jgi:hypothetical protein